MMRLAMAAAAVVALGSVCGAYTIEDNSGKAISERILSRLTEMAGHYVDPGHVRFRNLRIGPNNRLCGEMNNKNGFGKWVGYRTFMIDEAGHFLEEVPEDMIPKLCGPREA